MSKRLKVMPKKENTRLQVTISPANLNLLTKWATFHGKSAAEFAGQIIASRCESNLELIMRLDQAREGLEDEEQTVD